MGHQQLNQKQKTQKSNSNFDAKYGSLSRKPPLKITEKIDRILKRPWLGNRTKDTLNDFKKRIGTNKPFHAEDVRYIDALYTGRIK